MTVERNRMKLVDMVFLRKIVGTLLFLIDFDILIYLRLLVKPAS